MRFAIPRRRIPGENIVPMINVVFLLLIFFLMSARIAPPDPMSVAPPAAAPSVRADADPTLYIDAKGDIAFAQTTGAGVWPVLADLPPETTLLLRADAALEASTLAQVMARLADIGLGDVRLATVRP